MTGPPDSIEQQILEKLHQMDEQQQQQVLDFATRIIDGPQIYGPVELMQLSPAERARYVAAAFDAAKDEDFELF